MPDQQMVLDSYRSWLRKVAAGLIGDPHLQQDLAQEGWVAMWRALSTHDPARGALPAWLTQHALWRMRDCARDRAWLGRPPRHQGRGRVRDVVEYAASDTAVFDLLTAADLVEDVLIAYHRGEVLDAVNQLSPAQRWYVYLRFWRGYQYAELTAEFGYQPHGLWTSPVNGARGKLRRSLERLGAG